MIDECEKADFVGRSAGNFQTSTCAKSAISAKRPSPYQSEFEALERRCPELIEPGHWKQAVEDGRQFLATWGDQAKDLGWTAQELLGLHPVPAKPHASFERLGRYNSTGLVWLLRGRPVVKMTADSAAIRTASGRTLCTPRTTSPRWGLVGTALMTWGRYETPTELSVSYHPGHTAPPQARRGDCVPRRLDDGQWIAARSKARPTSNRTDSRQGLHHARSD